MSESAGDPADAVATEAANAKAEREAVLRCFTREDPGKAPRVEDGEAKD